MTACRWPEKVKHPTRAKAEAAAYALRKAGRAKAAMSHCGQKLQCPSRCACGDEVRAEHSGNLPSDARGFDLSDFGTGMDLWYPLRFWAARKSSRCDSIREDA